MGYSRAGFEVVGVDINPQPHYPFEFHQADALTYPLEGFDAYHASPPCQAFSIMRTGMWKERSHPELIIPMNKRLSETNKPFVIENVIGAKKQLNANLLLCGTMFGLQTRGGNQLRRHRIFYAPWFSGLTPPCQHNNGSAIRVYGGGQDGARKRPATIGVWGNSGSSSNRDGVAQFGMQDRKDAMGIDWMSCHELSESIPPAYTEYIGKYLMQAVLA